MACPALFLKTGIMLKLLFYDIDIQWRSGYWSVYCIMGLLYILILLNIPINIREEAAVGIIFMDTSVLGLIFVGALVLFEKQQGVLQSMAVTPLKLNTYIFSKTLSLTFLSTVISSVIWIFSLWSFKGYGFILSGVILSSVVFTIFGLGFSSGVKSFNQYLARIFIGSLIFSFPVLPFIIFPEMIWLIIFPTNAALDLFLQVSAESFSIIQVFDILILVIWIFIMLLFARKQFKKNNLFV
jgi:fluoroquinolone transport system permease protein